VRLTELFVSEEPALDVRLSEIICGEKQMVPMTVGETIRSNRPLSVSG